MARYIVNAGGIINSVNDADFTTHMDTARRTALQRTRTPDSASEVDSAPVTMPREATADEIVAWWASQGLVYDPATDEATPAKGKK